MITSGGSVSTAASRLVAVVRTWRRARPDRPAPGSPGPPRGSGTSRRRGRRGWGRHGQGTRLPPEGASRERAPAQSPRTSVGRCARGVGHGPPVCSTCRTPILAHTSFAARAGPSDERGVRCVSAHRRAEFGGLERAKSGSRACMSHETGRDAARGPVLQATKLHQPVLRDGTIRRARLTRTLVAARPSLTLVVAPPGFGKTSLLADWADVDPRTFAWVAIDRQDNDPTVLWTYIGAALGLATGGEEAADPARGARPRTRSRSRALRRAEDARGRRGARPRRLPPHRRRRMPRDGHAHDRARPAGRGARDLVAHRSAAADRPAPCH